MLFVGHGDGGRYYTQPARADYYAAGGESAAPKLDFFQHLQQHRGEDTMKSTIQSASRALAGLLQSFVRACLRRPPRPHGPLSFEEAQAPGISPVPVFWAGRWVPEDNRHYAIVGATCSGKSLLLSLYLRSVISQITPRSDRRLVLFDPNNELHSALFADVQVPVHFLLPSDERSSRWDLSRDFTSPAAILQFCQAFVPEMASDSNPFFAQALRELMGGVISSLNSTQAGRWDLADVVRILESRQFMAQVLGRTPETQSKLRFMGNQKTWENIAATVESRLEPLRILAALWSRSGRETFSLVDFVNSEGILVLGRDPRYAALLDPLNMLLLTQLFDRLLAQGDSRTRRTHLVLDEFTVAAGDDKPLPGFKDICERGAARGVVVAVTYQSYEDVKELYKDGGDAILGMLQNRVFLRAGDFPTAEFASKAFLKRHEWTKVYHYPNDFQSSSPTVSLQWHESDIVPYEKFLELNPGPLANGMTGYWLSPPPQPRETHPFYLPGDWLAANLPKRSENAEPYLRRSDAHQYLEPFSSSDLQRLELRLPERDDEGEGGADVRLPIVPLQPERLGWGEA